MLLPLSFLKNVGHAVGTNSGFEGWIVPLKISVLLTYQSYISAFLILYKKKKICIKNKIFAYILKSDFLQNFQICPQSEHVAWGNRLVIESRNEFFVIVLIKSHKYCNCGSNNKLRTVDSY